MVTSVGLSAAETATSVRAGISRFVETDFRDRLLDQITLAELADEDLPALEDAVAETGLTRRENRMLRIASLALSECLRALPSDESPPPLMLSLPASETARPLDQPGTLDTLARASGRGFDLGRSDASFRGRAGGLHAIQRAAGVAQSRAGAFALAGGVDSHGALYVLSTLDMQRRLLSPSNPDGFIPGEAAAFLLIASSNTAASRGLSPLAMVSEVSDGFEKGHLFSEENYRGEGLALTLNGLVQGNSVRLPIREVYSSMNGENHWAKEWGVAYTRNNSAFTPEHGMHHPADSVGDTGAACGTLMVGLAAMGVSEGYRGSPCLVYCSSDDGPRSALLVATTGKVA